MPTRVFLLRHAESADPNVFHGAESDVGLSERGCRQASAVARCLAAHEPAAVVSSAMRRAVATATPIAAACGLPLRLEQDLHERRVGILSGRPFHTHDGLWPRTLACWMAGDTAFAPPAAESFDAIRDRVLPVWNRLADDYRDRAFVLVAHGVVCKVLLLSVLEGFGPADWERLGPSRNVAIHELLHTGAGWQALRLDDVPDAVARC